MPSCRRSWIHARATSVLLALGLALGFVAEARAQANTTTTVATFVPRQVGGVSVDASGILTNSTRDDLGKLRRVLADAMQPVPDGMNQTAGLRKVSLKGLEAEIQKSLSSGKPLPDAVQCLAGLQGIRYVLAYPEQNDILLVGPAEGWKLDARGNVIGRTSGRPVLLLDDLLVTLRAAGANVRTVLSCSINPTPEGVQRLRAFDWRQAPLANSDALTVAYQQQLGPQTISVTGVPESSHFARVMVAADYRMKRISLKFEPSPVRGLPSFLDMMTATHGANNMMPRFWLEPVYDAFLKDSDGLAWELRGGAVQALSETDFLDTHGVAHPTGKSDPISQRWAKIMSDRYEELSVADPIFGQLRNCMDLAVVSALVVKEKLPGKVNNRLPLLTGSDGAPTAKLDAPKQVATQASLVKKGQRPALIGGGVQVNPWAFVEKSMTSSAMTAVHAKAKAKQANAWWWD